MNLIIVESPTKARTLSRFLGKDYEIMASMGHIRDLPKSNLGVEVKKDFAPMYEFISGKEETIAKLKKAAKKAKKIILATDPDREGEAIAYHVNYLLNKKSQRITFHEITKSAIEDALKNPGEINLSLVHSQQARRILDRLVGYKLSPLLWSKVRRGLSAGRVQSVALRFIVEREKEIAKFKAREYWTIDADFKEKFLASLYSQENGKIEKTTTIELFSGPYTYRETIINDEKICQKIEKDLQKQNFIIENIEEKETLRQPLAPFTTSTLQQASNSSFGYSAKKTMMLAQKLYEEGFITYHRTDSLNLAESAITNFRGYIQKTYGDKYLSAEIRRYQTKSKVAQEAHEAIRPTDINLQIPDNKLYSLIWRRALATQMAAAKLASTTIDIKAGQYLFKANGVRTLFDGFLRLFPKRLNEKILPKLTKGDKLNLKEILPKQNFTSPPPRYNEASLIKTLEAKGIGRPSTYASIISLIQDRGYVEKKEAAFWPTAVGDAVIEFLQKYFDYIIEIPFTAEMEEDLDRIARNEKKWVPVLKAFYAPFEKKVKDVAKNSERIKIAVEKTGKKCPKCTKGDQVIRTGKFGKFLSCSRFPDCDWKDNYQETIDAQCPECNSQVVMRRTHKGKFFYGCSGWPKCKWASWRKPTIAGQQKTQN